MLNSISHSLTTARPSLEPGAGASIQVTHRHSKKPNCLSHHCCIPESVVAGSWHEGQESGTEPSYSDVRPSCPSKVLTTMSNNWPSTDFQRYPYITVKIRNNLIKIDKQTEKSKIKGAFNKFKKFKNTNILSEK